MHALEVLGPAAAALLVLFLIVYGPTLFQIAIGWWAIRKQMQLHALEERAKEARHRRRIETIDSITKVANQDPALARQMTERLRIEVKDDNDEEESEAAEREAEEAAR